MPPTNRRAPCGSPTSAHCVYFQGTDLKLTPVPSCGPLTVGDILTSQDAEIARHKDQLTLPEALLTDLGLDKNAALPAVLRSLLAKYNQAQKDLGTLRQQLDPASLMKIKPGIDGGCLEGSCGEGTATLGGLLTSLVAEVCQLRAQVQNGGFAASTATYLPS